MSHAFSLSTKKFYGIQRICKVWNIPRSTFEALEPLRQGIAHNFGTHEKNTALGLSIRHDHGSQFTSSTFQSELHFLGIKSSPSYVREPQGNGIAELFVRTLKENLLRVQYFTTVEELRFALLDFKEKYNKQ